MNCGEAYIWLAALDLPDSEVEFLATLLSEDECRRTEQFHFPSDRRRFIVGRGILRVLLGSLLQLAPGDLRFHFGPSGKPSLDPGQNPPDLRFNLAHAQGLALYGVTRGQEMGVDLEYRAALANAVSIAEEFFSPGESEALLALPPSEQLDAFYTYWTRKEAYLKGMGTGLEYPLDRFEVSLAPGQPVCLLRTTFENEILAADRWLLYDVMAPPQYAAALAVEGPISHLCQWEVAFTGHRLATTSLSSW